MADKSMHQICEAVVLLLFMQINFFHQHVSTDKKNVHREGRSVCVRARTCEREKIFHIYFRTFIVETNMICIQFPDKQNHCCDVSQLSCFVKSNLLVLY